jgi:fluoroquinolone resistance protein
MINMGDEYFDDQEFGQEDFLRNPLKKGTYDHCSFSNCDFSGVDFTAFHFIDCSFESCNLSGANLNGTSIRETVFRNCKMMGIHFDRCHEFLFDPVFEKCNLDLSSFYRRKMGGKSFGACSLREVDFTESDLSGAVFDDADLSGAVFDQTMLESADFRHARGYSIDPERNKVRKAKFSADGLAGLLAKYDLSIE